MNGAVGRLRGALSRFRGTELYLFLNYALIPFKPGAAAPTVPRTALTAKPVPPDWSSDDLKLFIEEARIDVAGQQADKRDIRARAQIVLTTAIFVVGVCISAYSDVAHPSIYLTLSYALAALLTSLAGLASGGIISARSDIGTVNVSALTHYPASEFQRAAAEGYASTRDVGARTVADLVTVLRDCVLALIAGALFLAVAFLWGK